MSARRGTTQYGRSPWIDRFAKSRVRSWPQQRGRLDSDVVIVGGGLTGCAAAYAFAASGIKVVLVEANGIGQGSTGAAGWIAADPGVNFGDLEKALGRRPARLAFRAWRRAASDFAALLRALHVRCQLEQRGAIIVAGTADEAARLQREQKARRAAGFDASFLTARAVAAEVGLTATAGLRGEGGATLDPYRACLGLAAAAAARGARLFERSPAKKIKFGSKSVDVLTASGTVRADRVVVATGVPTPLFKALVRHFWLRSTYCALTEPLAARIRHQLGQRRSVVRDMLQPPHVVRWVDDERLLVMGADAESPPESERGRINVQRTGQLMYELSMLYPDISGVPPAYGWDSAYARTAYGLPHVGPHRNYPRHLFAFGDASDGVTGAYLASRILLRHYLGKLDPADEVFGFARSLER